jgi:molybdopterin/thiamine biosynthesis adenylyltransferase/rhodanese-related sulfurtransferase
VAADEDLVELEVDAEEASRLQESGVPLFDIRPEHERLAGSPSGARDWPTTKLPPPGQDLLLLCQSGGRSRAEALRLRRLGHGGALSVRGGYEAWSASGLPRESSSEAHLADRYLRQLALPEIGLSGQRRLARARVLLIGAGGLGSTAALYLAAAGVGRLGVADGDRVERVNLHRQVIHGEGSLGQRKTGSARRRLLDLNPELEFVAVPRRVGRDDVMETLTGWDLVIDGSDNSATRYLVNDACLALGLPLVYGAATAFEGQVALFDPGAEPKRNSCYRCLQPESEGLDAGQRDCASHGVLGTVPGLIGLLQATEALKWLLGIGESLVGRLLLVDLLSMEFRRLDLPPRAGCRCRSV